MLRTCAVAACASRNGISDAQGAGGSHIDYRLLIAGCAWTVLIAVVSPPVCGSLVAGGEQNGSEISCAATNVEPAQSGEPHTEGNGCVFAHPVDIPRKQWAHA